MMWAQNDSCEGARRTLCRWSEPACRPSPEHGTASTDDLCGASSRRPEFIRIFRRAHQGFRESPIIRAEPSGAGALGATNPALQAVGSRASYPKRGSGPVRARVRNAASPMTGTMGGAFLSLTEPYERSNRSVTLVAAPRSAAVFGLPLLSVVSQRCIISCSHADPCQPVGVSPGGDDLEWHVQASSRYRRDLSDDHRCSRLTSGRDER